MRGLAIAWEYVEAIGRRKRDAVTCAISSTCSPEHQVLLDEQTTLPDMDGPQIRNPRRRLGRSVIASVVVVAASLFPADLALARIGYVIDDGCGVGQDGLFWAGGSPSGWHTYSYSSSPGGCHMWTFTRIGSAVNTAAWYLPLNPGNSGDFAVRPFIPCINHAGRAHYQTLPYGTGGGVYNAIYISQLPYCNVGVQIFDRYFSQADQTAGYVKFLDSSDQWSYHVAVDQLSYLVL